MNRELKFRAWDYANEKMLPAQDLSQSIEYWTWLGKIDYPIMQYTGLKDCNGKEIYEGDVVIDDSVHKSLVSYDRGMFTPLVYVKENYNCIDKYHPELFEVIGNIYENPELIKETEK